MRLVYVDVNNDTFCAENVKEIKTTRSNGYYNIHISFKDGSEVNSKKIKKMEVSED